MYNTIEVAVEEKMGKGNSFVLSVLGDLLKYKVKRSGELYKKSGAGKI